MHSWVFKSCGLAQRCSAYIAVFVFVFFLGERGGVLLVLLYMIGHFGAHTSQALSSMIHLRQELTRVLRVDSTPVVHVSYSEYLNGNLAVVSSACTSRLAQLCRARAANVSVWQHPYSCMQHVPKPASARCT